uniref:Uncharacterized protein n=1 Tax=Trichobilharzia regenti TaxID=157069 RepID=A0AA85K3D1_TRIRE|nr:unnamed protein product [Trichobilharzia regenti]
MTRSNVELNKSERDPDDTDWRIWANQLLNDIEGVSNERSKYGLTSRGLKKLIDGLLYPIKKDLNEGVITTRLAFIHCLLKELACIAMKHSSDTREHAIATDLYRIWESQLTTSTTASYCSTPKEARVTE